jgi:hypothetical protein
MEMLTQEEKASLAEAAAAAAAAAAAEAAVEQFKSNIFFLLISYKYIDNNECKTFTFPISIDDSKYELKFIFRGEGDFDIVVSNLETNIVINSKINPIRFSLIVGLFILYLTPSTVDLDDKHEDGVKVIKDDARRLLFTIRGGINYENFDVTIKNPTVKKDSCVVMGGKKTKRKSNKRMMKRKSKKRMMKRKSKNFFRR